MTNNSKQSEVVSSNQRVEYRNGLALRLQEWSRNCLIDGLKMDKGEPTLQSLLREAVSLLLAVETTVPDTGLSAATVAEMLRVEAAVVKLGTCMPPGRFPEGVSKYNALMWAAELIDQRSAVEPTPSLLKPAVRVSPAATPEEAARGAAILRSLKERPTRWPHSCDCWRHENQVCDVCQGVSDGYKIRDRLPEKATAAHKDDCTKENARVDGRDRWYMLDCDCGAENGGEKHGHD